MCFTAKGCTLFLNFVEQLEDEHCTLHRYCQVFYSASADVIHFRVIARYCTLYSASADSVDGTGIVKYYTVSVQKVYSVQVLPGIDNGCADNSVQVLYSAIADIVHCSGIVRY